MPNRRQVLVACLSSAGAMLAATTRPLARQRPASAAVRSAAFWTHIVDDGFAVPAGETPVDLLLELGTHFGDRDPVLRDRCGYGITARWVVRDKRLSNVDLQRLATAWLPGLLADRDPAGGEAVLLRSFSALGLSLVSAADLAQRALDGATLDALVERGARQLATNTDRRGFDPSLGWVHVTAHTADLLKFVGRHPSLPRARQQVVLDAVASATVSAPSVFQWGEDERLARAAASILRRADVDDAAVARFLQALAATGVGVDWEQPLAHGGLAPLLNAKAVLKDLHLVLTVAGIAGAREQVQATLDAMP